jgi:hypothetical protein
MRQKIRSVEPTANTITIQLRKAAPAAVPIGRSRGRSTRSWRRASRVSLRSIAGQANKTANTNSGNAAPPQDVAINLLERSLGEVKRRTKVMGR